MKACPAVRVMFHSLKEANKMSVSERKSNGPDLARSKERGPPIFFNRVPQSPPSTYSNTMQRCFWYQLNNESTLHVVY
jgi:hypothetical protein